MTKDLTARLANLTPKQRELLLKKLRSKPNTTKKQTTIASQQRRGTMVPATDSQFQLWVPDNLANELPQYNIPIGLRLHGSLQPQRLVAALHAIIVRHEILRTSFHNQDGQLMQKIHDAVVLDVPLVDLQGCAAEKREGEALRIMRADAKRPFQTHTLPLMRATLIRLTAQEHILYVTKHHIISDGWSIGLFYDELLQQYDHLTRHTAPLAPLPIQFSDYALWQQSTESQAQHQKQLNYWQQKLSGELPIFELPADFPRPRIISHQGDVQTCLLPQAIVQQMEAVSQQAGATLSMTLLAVFKLLMLRYTGSTDLLVGTAIANRQRKEIEGLIGLFLNTLVIRTDMSGDPAFLTLLQQVRRSTLEAYDNQDLPYGRLVEAIQPERTTNHNPVFQSYFGMQNYPYATLKAGELRATALPDGYVHTQTSKIDLSLMVYNEGDNLRCVFEYSTDLFRPDTIGRLMGHWQTLIANVAANPAQRLSAYGILTAAEETQIIQSWNESSAPYPHQTLHQRFQEQAERWETAVAVSCTDTQLTYGELDAQTNQLARHLQALGVQRGTFVGILMIESVERVVAVLATLKAGGAYVPLDPAYPKERLSFMLSDTQTPILITQSELLPQLPSHNATNVCLDTVDLSTYSSAALDVPVTPNDLAYVIYTSGSTGKPKGVCCAHAGVQNLLANFDQWQPLEVKQNSAWWTSFNFDVSVYELFAPLMCGAALHIVPSEDRLDIDKFAEWMLHQQIHSAYIPPFMLAPLVARWQANTALPPLQRLLVGVEPISESLLVQMRQLMPDLVIINGYGPTETTVCATLYPVPQQVTHDGNTPIGRPTQNLDLYLLDEQMQPVAVGIPGELYIGGIGVAHGYLNLPGLTAVNFVPNPFNNAQGARLYRTGDLVRYLPDGTLIFVGRRDHQVKLHGYRIELGEIEAQLVKHPDIHESVVTVFEASPNDQRLVAYITADTDMIPQLTLPLLRDYLQQTLPDYMLPSAFVGLEALPQTPNGKVNRKALPEPIDSFAQTNGTAPRTLIEEMVAAMWTQLLGQQKADIFANFFECGGHSLLAIRLLAQIEKQLQVTVPLGQFFTNPTIATLGKHIDAARKSQQQIPITPITPQVQGNCAPLSSAQKRMWILYQLSPRAATYNVPIVLQMEGDLNLEALERTLNEIVARHAILRTTYEMQQGQPISVIHPAQERPLPVYDLTHLSGTEQEQAARQTITHLVSQPFDLTNGPLVRTQIVRLAEKQHILLLATHHIAMDGWSISIFAQEMATLYTAHVQEQSVSLPNLPIQYGDYAIWQQAWMQSDGFQQQLDYWRERLAGEQTVLRLPTDHPLPKEPALVAQGVVHSWHWDKALCQDVIRFAQSEGYTPYIVMLAVLQLLLHRYSGQSNVNVGSPIANRNRPEVAEMIGFFVNTLVITAVFNRVTTFRELLQQVQQEALGAFDRQDMPFDELVKAFQQGQRQVDQQPFFQVMFNFQRGGDNSQIEMPGLSLSFAEGGAQTAKFDLLIEGAEVEGAFGWNLVYRKALFDEETIVTLVAQMEHLLRQVMAAPDEQVNNYALWADDVQARWQDTAVLLQQHPAVKETAVCAWQDVPTARGLAAYIVLENGTDLSAKAVHQYLIAQKSQVVPPNIIFVEQLNGSLPMPPSMDDNQSQDLHTRTQVLSAQAQLAKKKAALSAKKKALLEKMLTRRALSDKKDRPAAIPVRSPNAIIPLSYNQERLWFLQQLSPSAAYNMPFRFEMTFALDVQALQRSVITIIERHEVLRTRFEMMDEQPVQVIHPTDGFALPMTDLSDKQKAEQDATWQTLSDADAQRPFNFTQDYLIRFHLVRFSNTHYRLILTLHHIAFDGWSWGVLLRELTALYAAFSQGKPNPLTPLSIQYADFSVWQRQPQQQQKYEKQLAYWQQQLQDAPAALELPTDFARTAVPTYQGAAYELTLPPELGVQIKSLLQTAELTPFTLYFAAFSLLLYRYTGQDDIVIGTPVANRLLREVEPLIGFFVNTLALRLRLSPTMTISDLLQQARQVMLDAQGNQDVPFESVVQAVQPDRELSRQPLFQVMVLAQEDGESRMDDAFPASISVGDSRTAKFDLLISFAPSGSSLLLEYSTDLFAEDTIARMAAHMQVLLTALVQNPTQTVSQIPLLTRLERTQLLHDWNETAVSTNLNRGVHHLFEAQAEQTPDAPAVTFGNTTWTYRELDERANQLAHYLIEAGITLDSRVGVCMHRSLEMMVSVLGILKAGAAYVPLDPAYPEERLVYMMENAETAVLLTQSTLTSPPHRHTVLLDQMGDKLGRYPKNMVETAVSGQNLLYVIYTSGSTGQPKGIAMPHAPMVNIMQWHKTQTRMHDSARTLQFSSFSFDVSCQEMFTTWMTGGTLVLIDEDTQRDAQQLLTFLHTKSIERLFLPFVALQQLAEVAEASDVYPQTLTHVVTAGEQLQSTRHIVNFCNHLPHCRLHNHYGPAETHVVSAYTLSETPEEWDALPSIGTPVANTQLYILDGQMAPVPVGVSGMLYIGGDHISRGYMARPRLTAERYIPNPFGNNDRLYKTGDLARYLADGRIQFLGRRDFQVKIRGYRIELGELETILNQHPQVRRAVVAAPIVRQANAPDERRLVAYVVPVHADETGVEEELRQFLLAQMPSYMVPGFFMFLETLPKTPSGKIDRRHLPTPGVSPTASFVPPRDVVELKLAELWQEVLGLTAVGIHDNFFSVGGHSLLAVRMVSRMQALFGQTVPVAALFQNSSIAQLAAILRNKGDFSTMSPLVKIREQGSNPPLFLVHPGGGNVLPYVELAQYVDAERPLYGFQSLGLTAHDQIQYTIEEMATTYVEALKDVQPHGPYALGGWSMGGTVALEMAQQLQANGDEIAHLILIDTDAPLTAAEEAAFDTLTFQISFARDMGITPEELRALNLAELDEAERLTAVLTYAISVERLPADLTLETVRHLYHVFETNYRAMVAYTPERPYAGHVTLLKAEEEPRPDYDSTFNWQPWVTGGLDVHIVPGNHFTLVRPPHLTTLATQINTALNYEKETMRL